MSNFNKGNINFIAVGDDYGNVFIINSDYILVRIIRCWDSVISLSTDKDGDYLFITSQNYVKIVTIPEEKSEDEQ